MAVVVPGEEHNHTQVYVAVVVPGEEHNHTCVCGCGGAWRGT